MFLRMPRVNRQGQAHIVFTAIVSPKAENLSMGTAAAHMRADFAGDLQSNPSDSPEFTPWGPDED